MGASQVHTDQQLPTPAPTFPRVIFELVPTSITDGCLPAQTRARSVDPLPAVWH